jgi:hypothetical protein
MREVQEQLDGGQWDGASMSEQLECRILITHRRDRRVDLAMCDPLTGRVERLGTHGPGQREVDRAVRDLADTIVRAGHRLTFSELTGPR